MVQEEKVQTGKISFKDVTDMMKFSIGCPGIFIYVVLSVSAAVLQLAPSLILSKFTLLSHVEQQKEENSRYMHGFIGSILLFVVVVFLRSIFF